MTFQDHDPARDAIEQDNRLQPDPELQLSGGRATPLQIASTVAACALVVGLVIYGLNNQRPEGADAVASTEPAAASASVPSPSVPQQNAQQGQQGQTQKPQGQNPQSQNQGPAETTGSGSAGSAATPAPQPNNAPPKK